MNNRFEYTYRVKTSDLWQASMYYAYSSYMGVVNAVFIVSAVVLIISRWKSASDLFRSGMVILLLLFTVIQPLVIWLRARASLGNAVRDITLVIDGSGLRVKMGEKEENRSWDDIRGIVKKPTIMIIYTGDGAGYILRNSVLGNTKKALYDHVTGMKQGK